MQQRKSKKVFIYFFLMLMLGSITNNEINNQKFYEIKNIIVSGLNENDNNKILTDFKEFKSKNIFQIDANEIQKIINSNSLIENYRIYKNYPSILKIKLEQTKFLAKINYDDKQFLVGSNGKLSKNNSSGDDLPFIFGKPDVKEFLEFKKNIDSSKFSYDQIKNLYFYPSKRWDLELKDNIILKLPKNDIKFLLNRAFEFINDKNLKNNKTIDLRVKNQIILNE